MSLNEPKIVQYKDVSRFNLHDALTKEKSIGVAVNNSQASRLKKDWDRFGSYKKAYFEGHRNKGLWLSFVWMMSNIFTSFMYGKLERISDVYYEFYRSIEPVEFLNKDEDIYIVIFRLKK